MAARREQPAKRNAQPGDNPDDQAADLEPASAPAADGGAIGLGSGAGQLRQRRDYSFLACTSKMDAAAGHRQKARSSGPSGRGTS